MVATPEAGTTSTTTERVSRYHESLAPRAYTYTLRLSLWSTSTSSASLLDLVGRWTRQTRRRHTSEALLGNRALVLVDIPGRQKVAGRGFARLVECCLLDWVRWQQAGGIGRTSIWVARAATSGTTRAWASWATTAVWNSAANSVRRPMIGALIRTSALGRV
jgi:hypothetical protein